MRHNAELKYEILHLRARLCLIGRVSVTTFCLFRQPPLSGKFLFSVSKKRGAIDYAKCIHRISRRYPEAKKIHLIQDKLNTHGEKSLIKTYGSSKAKEI